jgi:isopenicillin N synthase-like dioxygenase
MHHRAPKATTGDACASIPIIDAAPLLRGLSSGKVSKFEQSVVNDLMAAAEGIGFVAVRNHGVPKHLQNSVHRQTGQLFALPLSSKLQCARKTWNSRNPFYLGYFPASADGKEGFDIGMNIMGDLNSADLLQNSITSRCPWHEDQPFPAELGAEFVGSIRAYRDSHQLLGRAIMRGIGIGMGWGAEYFEPHLQAHASTLRLNHYPPRQQACHTTSVYDGVTELACAEHQDSGLLTLLWQDQTGGLEVLVQEEEEEGEAEEQEGRNLAQGAARCARWLPIPPALGRRSGDSGGCGVVLVNFGRFLSLWTQGRVKATTHRVRFQVLTRRVSIPFFFAPNIDTAVNVMEPPFGGITSDDAGSGADHDPNGPRHLHRHRHHHHYSHARCRRIVFGEWLPRTCATYFKEYERVQDRSDANHGARAGAGAAGVAVGEEDEDEADAPALAAVGTTMAVATVVNDNENDMSNVKSKIKIKSKSKMKSGHNFSLSTSTSTKRTSDIGCVSPRVSPSSSNSNNNNNNASNSNINNNSIINSNSNARYSAALGSALLAATSRL